MSDMMHNEDQIVGTEEEQERLGRRLRESREYVGLSQEFVAEQLRIPRASISAIETGKRKVSSLELKHFARLYKCSAASLLEEEDIQGEPAEDAIVHALFRTARELSEQDRQQLLKFAQFLRQAGSASQSRKDATDQT